MADLPERSLSTMTPEEISNLPIDEYRELRLKYLDGDGWVPFYG
jgi:hypothetical protein